MGGLRELKQKNSDEKESLESEWTGKINELVTIHGNLVYAGQVPGDLPVY